MQAELLSLGSEALKKAALNQAAKDYLLSNGALFQLLKKAANRYIGGETLLETVQKVKEHNAQGFTCSIEFMGENTTTSDEADAAKNEFVEISK